jgi:hypothetical protein
MTRISSRAVDAVLYFSTRTEPQRAESHLPQTLWLKMAREDNDNEDACRLRIALQATK